MSAAAGQPGVRCGRRDGGEFSAVGRDAGGHPDTGRECRGRSAGEVGYLFQPGVVARASSDPLRHFNLDPLLWVRGFHLGEHREHRSGRAAGLAGVVAGSRRDHRDRGSGLREFQRARQADDARADHRDVC